LNEVITDKKDNFFRVVQELISQQKFGEAINYLQKIVETDPENFEAAALLEQIQKIMEYRNKDIFSSTNLDMDPWME
jgi:uncharacterized Zn finger protein